jgi:HTH-type transcriptional regulator/antitoxin HigA
MSHRPRTRTEHTYLELVLEVPLRPIRSDEELHQAHGMLDRLTDRLEDLDSGERDYLDVLATLVEQYEKATIPMPSLPDHAMVKFFMESNGLSQTQLARDTGIAVSTISEVLAEKRHLTRGQVQKLARHFQIGVGAFALK